MSAFEEMAAAFQGHVKKWEPPPACEADKGRYAIMVCNWVSTSVPFFSTEIACALRQEGCEVTVLWDSARVGVEAPSEVETKIIGDTVRALPPWLEVADVNEAAAAMLAGWGCDYLQGALIGRATIDKPWASGPAPYVAPAITA